MLVDGRSVYRAGFAQVDWDDIPLREDVLKADEDDVLDEYHYLRRHNTYQLWELDERQESLLAFTKRILDANACRVCIFLEIGAGNFLEWQKAMPFAAVLDKSGFEARLKAGNNCFVDIALALFLAGRFNVEVNKLLTINNGDTQFFRLCRIK